MYTEEELNQVRKKKLSRLRIAVLPAVLLLAAATALFVYGQLHRSDTLWMVTAALTIVAGSWFLFLFGVYVRPLRLYQRHVETMLHGRMRQTTGALKSIATQTCEKNGVECYALMLNVGQRDDGEDDRLFYYDAHKERPNISLGQRVTIQSNDMMVAGLTAE